MQNQITTGMTINCNGKLIDLKIPKTMGILNLTPDSFYDGGKLKNNKAILLQAEKMLHEGATFLDLGGYSSRPGADHVSEEEEKRRILPTITLLLKELPQVVLSIDTFRSSIAREAISYGACMINDISGGSIDEHMIPTVGSLQVPYIGMHMRGTPQTMASHATYENVTKEVLLECSEILQKARAHNINDVIIDPGFGFAKTTEHNFELLQNLELFSSLNCPLLIGISRKSMIYKTLKINAERALNGTTALHSLALFKGAHILRVHDVQEAQEAITLLEHIKK